MAQGCAGLAMAVLIRVFMTTFHGAYGYFRPTLAVSESQYQP
jgi:hypothetical protein